MLKHLKGDIPPDVMPKVIKCLQNLNPAENAQDEEIVLTLWDFAGQHLYYASHGIFLTGKAIYLMIYDLSKDLNEPCEEESNQTRLENIVSWLACVHSTLQSDSNGKDASGSCDYLLPPMLIIGTHAGKPHGDMEKLIKDKLKQTDERKHVVKYFKIENNSDCRDTIKEIQTQIVKILREESRQKMPLKWFHFEKVGCLLGCEKRGVHLPIGQVHI